MLTIHIDSMEYAIDDEKGQTIEKTKPIDLVLEHSLVSISKWEAKYHKPFLDETAKKTAKELIYYIECMTLTKNVDPQIYQLISSKKDIITKINSYIADPNTATTFTNNRMNPIVKQRSKQKITNELIYSWMISFGIPIECEKWHINRLMTLIRICNINNDPNNKLSKKDLYSRQRAINAARRKPKV